MKSVLLVAYSYTPEDNPRAVRWSSIAEHWASRGIDVDVVCGGTADLPARETIGSVHVYRPGRRLIATLRGRLRGREDLDARMSRFDGSRVRVSSVKQILARAARVAHDATWKKLYWPDRSCLWYFPASRCARDLYAARRHDAVVTVSHPFTGHLVGLHLRKRHPDMRWLVDVGDPLYFCDQVAPNNRWLYRRLNFAAEHRVLGACDRIAVTCRGVMDRYAELWPDVSDKIRVIYPLARAADLPDAVRGENENKIDVNARPIDVVYVGNLYRRARNPTPVFHLFATLAKTHPHLADRLRLTFIGGHDCPSVYHAADRLGPSMVRRIGPLPRVDAWARLRKADVLLYLGNNNAYQLPSKVVECAALGKPILSFHHLENDESLSILTGHPLWLPIDVKRAAAQPEQTGRRLAEFLEKVLALTDRQQAALRAFGDGRLHQYGPEAIAAEYLDAICERCARAA